MSEENTEPQEAPESVKPQEAHEAVEAQGGPDESVIELAKSRGWKDPADWKGDRSGLIEDPEEFNRLFEDRMPSVLRENRNLQAEIGELRTAVESMADWRARMDEANAKQRDKELESLKHQLKLAVDAGDHRLAERIVNRRDELRASPEPKKQQVNSAADPAFAAWVDSDDGAWYRDAQGRRTDPRVAHGIQIAEHLKARGITPQSHGRAFYEEVSRQVQQAFKLKQARPEVEGGNRQPAKAPSKKVQSWNQLPKDVREAQHVQQLVSRMYMKAAKGDAAKARDLYAKDWQQRQEVEN